MKFAYVDESGYPDTLPNTVSNVQPVFVIGALLVDRERMPEMTSRFLDIKSKYFPGLPTSRHRLDAILAETKGTELRKRIRTGGRDDIRHTIGYLDRLMELIEDINGKIVARILVKGVGMPLTERPVYTSYVQALCVCFQKYLEGSGDTGLMILDGRSHHQDAIVSHSVFTQKFQASGDVYDRLVEMPVFGPSQNHAGVQLADILCSALIAPIAMFSYCMGYVTSYHVNAKYGVLKSRYASRLNNMQFRYDDPQQGRMRGGITVDDKLGQRSAMQMFK